MSTRTVTIRTAAIGGAMAAVAALTVAPAQAATGYDRCPANRLCVFTGPGGTGAIGIFQRGDVDLGAAPGPSGLDDNIESAWNRTAKSWYFYPDRNYNGGDGISGIVPRTIKATMTKAGRNETSSLKPIG